MAKTYALADGKNAAICNGDGSAHLLTISSSLALRNLVT
jgi:hypothetical protein